MFPPVPAFYAAPASLDDVIDQTLSRVLDLFDVDLGVVRRWRESAPDRGGRVPVLASKK